MLSQITFAEKSRAQEDARKDNHHNNKQKISKHRKSKSAKGGKRNSTPRHSRSPSLQDSRPTTALQGTSADAVLCTREQSPMIADIALVKDSDQMEGLLHSMSAGTSTKPAVQTKSSGECSKAAAPRLQETSGRISGLVGDGGNNWRRRMQRRAAAIQNGQGDELPRDVHHGDHTGGPKRKVHTADQSFIGSGGKMRRPAKDITSAFRRARHFELKDPARQVHNAEASRAVSAGDSGQHDGGKTTQLSGHGTRAARLDRAHPSRMVEPAPSCVDTVRGANTSAAAQLKARLRGDSIPVVLVETGGLTDARKPPDQAQSDQVRRPRQLQRFADGKKQQYFEDDALHSTAALAKKARMGVDMHDIDEAMTRNILSKRHFRAQDLDVDDEYDFDAGLELSERLQGKAASKKRKPVQHDSASQPPLRAPTDLIERQCHRCFMGAKRESDLTVSVGMHAYMAIPERGSLGAGHVCIMPVGHSPSFREADDGVFEELKNFQKCLINMYEAEGMSCIFFETALRVKQSRTHACIDCVPVDADAFAAAPIMFKKEITESESEWSQHHAKSIVDTSEKGLRRCVPPKFPYFHVQYGYKRGSVHVIDDEHKWERGFGRSVLVSLTGGQEVEMYRRAQRLDSQTVMSRKYEFLKKWGRFDWTRELE